MIRTLHNIANIQLRERACAGQQGFVEELDTAAYGPAIYSLALDFAQQSALSAEHILPALFEPEALPVLLAMPNHYWFWRVIKEACMYQTNEYAKVTHRNVLKAIRSIKNWGSQSQMFRDYSNGAPLTPESVGFLAASGVLLYDIGNMQLVQNPVYCKDFTA